MPPTVLLADADPDSRTVYATILEHHGFRVLQARDAATARLLACAEQPDVIVAELFFPLFGGEPLAVLLKRDGRTARTPVIGLTALPATVVDVPGLAACDRHLLKPCTPSLLLSEVRRMMERPPAIGAPLTALGTG